MKAGDYVEIKEADSDANWRWSGRKGHITAADEHCFSVRTDDGVTVHDTRDHFRPAKER